MNAGFNNKSIEYLKSLICYLLGVYNSIARKFYRLLNYEGDKIIIISLHKLGDSVFTIPAINKIYEFHKKKIAIICYPETMDIYKLAFTEFEFVTISHHLFLFKEMIAGIKARKILRNLKPSIIYDLTGNIRSASLIFSTKANEIVGINKLLYKNFYTKYTTIRSDPHLVDIYFDAVQLKFPDLSRDIPERTTNPNKNGYFLIHPFAGWAAKEWNLRKFIQLAVKLSQKYCCVFVVPALNKIKKDMVDELILNKIKLFEANSTIELINIIVDCSVFIGNDSGPVHIANLLGKPTFTIYGPTNPNYHIPLTGLNKFVQKPVNCSPAKGEKVCFTNGGRFGCPSYECMNTLSLEVVHKKLEEFLTEIGL